MPALTFFLAFVAVLALIGAAAWLVRRFANSRLGASPNRGRMPRLAVIDAAAVDGRRRLVLVRRDNIEHLLMIGGPTDIVVEPNIVRAQARVDQMPQRPPGTAETPRLAPLPEAGAWADGEGARTDAFDHRPEPQMAEPPRPPRPAFAEEMRRPSVLAERRAERERTERNDAFASFSPEPTGLRPEPRPEPRAEPKAEPHPEPRAERPEPTPPRMPRGEPLMPRPLRVAGEPPKAPSLRAERSAPPPPQPPQPPPPPPPSPLQTADQNLAEMAQRLEAALRRPAASADAPPVAPEPPPPPVRAAREPATPPAPAPSAKSSFENLEEEMASLLGRPKSSSS